MSNASPVRTVFITGSSSGIGRATAQYFLDQGWNVIATSLTPDKNPLPSHERLLQTRTDVRSTPEIRAAIDAGIARFGRIDVVVNNAGYGLLGPLEATTEDEVRAQFETNVFGVINVIRAALPHFREQKGGIIINISSMLGRITLPFFSSYAATKFAVEGLTEDLYYELMPHNIRTKLIEPGTIKTNFFGPSAHYTAGEANAPYQPYWDSVRTNVSERGADGENPLVVAKAIYRAATDNSMRLRYPTDRTARVLLSLRAISPLWLFRFIVSVTVR